MDYSWMTGLYLIDLNESIVDGHGKETRNLQLGADLWRTFGGGEGKGTEEGAEATETKKKEG